MFKAFEIKILFAVFVVSPIQKNVPSHTVSMDGAQCPSGRQEMVVSTVDLNPGLHLKAHDCPGYGRQSRNFTF